MILYLGNHIASSVLYLRIHQAILVYCCICGLMIREAWPCRLFEITDEVLSASNPLASHSATVHLAQRWRSICIGEYAPTSSVSLYRPDVPQR
eukprot:g73190.t1